MFKFRYVSYCHEIFSDDRTYSFFELKVTINIQIELVDTVYPIGDNSMVWMRMIDTCEKEHHSNIFFSYSQTSLILRLQRTSFPKLAFIFAPDRLAS